ncbi:MAG TPA: hypothetical protein VIJ50_01650 [Solirubrobacteraceae bacterium]
MTLTSALSRRVGATTLVVTATLAVGVSHVGSASAAKKQRPPCTKRALTAGLRRSRASGRIDGKNSNALGCAGHFAYAIVLVDNRDDVTVLFRAGPAGWVVAARARYCDNHLVPKRIYQMSCETN